MKPHLLVIACATGLMLTAEILAAPAPADEKNSNRPTVSLQVKSLDELLGSLKTTAKTFLSAALYEEFEQKILSELDPDKVKGVAANKPFGLYATIGEGLVQGNLSKSSLVALIPVANEKAFVELLGKTDLPIEKKDDAYWITIPNAPVEVSVRFLKGYAYVVVATVKFDSKELLDPKELFDETEKAAVALRIRTDRLPDDLKKKAAEQMSKIADVFKDGVTRAPNFGNFGIGAQDLLFIFVAPLAKFAVDDDVKEIVDRFDLDAKAGSFVNEISVETKKGTNLAKRIGGMQPTKNVFAGVIGADSVAHASFQVPLFDAGVKSSLGKLVDAAAKMLEQNAEKEGEIAKEARVAAAEAFKALRRTIDDANLDLAASLRGPDANGQYTAVGAFSLKDTPALEKSLKDAVKVAQNAAKAAAKELNLNEELFWINGIKVDAFKINGVNVHEIIVGDRVSADAQKIFGKSSVYVALAPNAVFVTFGSSGKAMMQEVLTQKLVPKPTPLLDVSVSGKRLTPFLKKAGAQIDGPAGQFLEKLSKIDPISVASVKVAGGDKLVIRMEFSLAPLYLLR